MILYNVTVNIDNDVSQDWVDWMKGEHIAEVMDTGYFNDCKIMRMLSESPDETGSTFAVQYTASSLTDLENYLETVAPKLQKKTIVRYGTKLMAFRTVLEEI